jgi:hypothetical protein
VAGMATNQNPETISAGGTSKFQYVRDITTPTVIPNPFYRYAELVQMNLIIIWQKHQMQRRDLEN